MSEQGNARSPKEDLPSSPYSASALIIELQAIRGQILLQEEARTRLNNDIQDLESRKARCLEAEKRRQQRQAEGTVFLDKVKGAVQNIQTCINGLRAESVIPAQGSTQDEGSYLNKRIKQLNREMAVLQRRPLKI